MDTDPLGFHSHDVWHDVVVGSSPQHIRVAITNPHLQDEAQPLGTNPFENGADDFPEEAPPPAYESVMMSDSLLMSNGVRATCATAAHPCCAQQAAAPLDAQPIAVRDETMCMLALCTLCSPTGPSAT